MAHIALTGASAGIGAATAVGLARQGHRVWAMGRDPGKLRRVHERMRAAAPDPSLVPAPLGGDLASLSEVRRLSGRLLDEMPTIDVLINNAGIQPPSRATSPDGHELVLAVNHLAPFLMTNLLLDRLRAAEGRVITTASSNHETGELDLADLPLEHGWMSRAAYDRSKLANVLFAAELTRRGGVPSFSVHPGSISTDLNRDSRVFRLVKPFEKIFYGSPERGADTLIWLTNADAGSLPSSGYFENRTLTEPAPAGRDEAAAADLWEASATLVGLATSASAERA